MHPTALSHLLHSATAHAEPKAPPAWTPPEVVWVTPGHGPNDSMPLGNGDIGVNAYTEQDGSLLLLLSKTDAWSGNAQLLKLGRVRITFEPVLVDATGPFMQRLIVDKGVLRFTGGPSAQPIEVEVWVDANYPAVRVAVSSASRVSMNVSLESWRTERRELTGKEREGAYGLQSCPDKIYQEADTFHQVGPRVLWSHRNTHSIWEMTLRKQDVPEWVEKGEDPLIYLTFGGLIADTSEPWDRPHTFQCLSIYAYTGQTKTIDHWNNQMLRIADADPAAASPDAWNWAKRQHEQWWEAFWKRSWIDLRSETEDVAHIAEGYALQRYINACAGRGAFPIKFNGSIFTVDAELDDEKFDPDFRKWGGPYWFQNTRLAYWPMLASGDFDLMQPFFRMYREMLPFCEERTRLTFDHGGAFYAETCYSWGAYAQENYGWERDGSLPRGVPDNPYIVRYFDGALELSAIMLDYFRFTGDAAFVREILLPVADAVVRFYFEHYPRGEDGKLFISPSQSLETFQKADNPLPHIAGLRWVLEGLLELPGDFGSAEQRAQWQEWRELVPELPMRNIEGQPALSPAEVIHEERRNHENPELYAVFPYRLYGVGKPDLELARHTFVQREKKINFGWAQDETQAAFLGLSLEAAELLNDRLRNKHKQSRFPAFWGPNFDWIPDQDHGGNALMALQTMLLQAEDGVIRLLPAWPRHWDVDAKLHAPMGTTVRFVLAGGELKYIEVTPEERRKDVVLPDDLADKTAS